MIKIQEESIWRTMCGPCFGHKRAMFWPFLGKGATGETQQCEIWHRTSLGTMIKIQKEPILRTKWEPHFSHKWPYLAIFMKVGYRIHPAMWNFAWNISGHIDQDSGKIHLKDHWGPYFDHNRAIFWPCPGTTGWTQQCELWHGASLGTMITIQEEPCGDYVLVIKGPYFGHF